MNSRCSKQISHNATHVSQKFSALMADTAINAPQANAIQNNYPKIEERRKKISLKPKFELCSHTD
jgi:hypothetical protein